MADYAVAFVTPEVPSRLIHKIVSAETQNEALKKFFEANATGFYSSDDKGYHYFIEDFSDQDSPAGSILSL